MKTTFLLLMLFSTCLWSYGQQGTKAEFFVNITAPGDGWDIPNQKFGVDVFGRGGEIGKETVLLSIYSISEYNNNTNMNIKKVKYRGKTYNVPDDMIGMELSKSFEHWIDSYKYLVNIDGKDYTAVRTSGGGGTILPISYDPSNFSDFKITNLRIVEIKFKEESLKKMVDAINKHSQEATTSTNTDRIVASSAGQTTGQSNTQTATNQASNNSATQTASNSNTTAISTAGQSAGAIGTSSVKSVEQMRKEREEAAKAVSDYNAAEKAKSDALKQATDETTSQWAQGNYIQGAKPLVDEFARQGSAAGAYGTAGVAVAAEIGSAIGDVVAARRARKAEEAAYNYEVDQGYNALRNRSYKDALKWYYSSYLQRKNALLSATHVGYMLMRGLGAEKNYSEALKFLNEAANGFSSDTKNGGAAYFFLAEMYRKGLGVSRDPYKAFQLMEEAAKRDKSFSLYAGYNGSEEAYYHLAFQYLAGVGITQNFQKAYDMFLALIDYDLKHEANLGLGVMYYYGLGLKKDIKTAARYFIVASADGNSDALALIKKICDNNELRGKELADLEKAYAKVVSKRYVNRITNNTFGEFLKLN